MEPTADISKFTARDVAELADRLERDEYSDPFASLRDWHLLRAISLHRPELVEPYAFLLDIEPYDEC